MSWAWMPDGRWQQVLAQVFASHATPPVVAQVAGADPVEYRIYLNGKMAFQGSPDRCSDFVSGLAWAMGGSRS